MSAQHTAAVEQVAIRGEMIRLGQLLKLAGIVDSGSEVKAFLAAEPVLVMTSTRRAGAGKAATPATPFESARATYV